MAKENKKASIMDVNEENFSEMLKKENTFSKEIVEMAQQNKEKERQAREYGEIADKAAYRNLRMVADAKYAKKTADIYKEAREESKKLLDRVSAGELTAIEYDKELDKTIDSLVKKVETLGKELRDDRAELRKKFPNHWSFNWDNPFARLNRAIENNRD